VIGPVWGANVTDLFISYTSHDRPWAERLYSDLAIYYPTIKVFWDRDAPGSLPPGVVWADALLEEARNAKHMIVLWSNKAQASVEVGDENSNFRASLQKEPHNDGAKRTLFYLPLEGLGPSYLEQRQGLTGMRDRGTYDPNAADRGTAKLDTEPHLSEWRRVIGIVGDTVLGAEATQPMNLAVLVTTANNLNVLQSVQNILPEIGQYLAAAGLTFAQATSRYGKSAFDWTPFGTNETVIVFMEKVRMMVNPGLQPDYRFHWRPYDLLAELIQRKADLNAIRRWVDELAQKPTVIVVDGLSLLNPVISRWLQALDPCKDKKHVVIVSLAPHEVPTIEQLYDGLRGSWMTMFDKYFFPDIPPASFAQCGANIHHVPDIGRLIRGGIGTYYSEQHGSHHQPFTGMGR
jgi:hypothetical protein